MKNGAYYQILGKLLTIAGETCPTCAMGNVPRVTILNVWHKPPKNSNASGTACAAAHIWQLSDLKNFLDEVTGGN